VPVGSPDPTEFVGTGLVETKRNPASAGSLSEKANCYELMLKAKVVVRWVRNEKWLVLLN